MSFSETKVKAGLTRMFSNDRLTYPVYLVWGVITLLFFGFFGLIPASKTLVDNFNFANDMTRTNSDLTKKVAELKKMKQDLDTISSYTGTLEISLPDYYDAQNHMVELSFLVNKNGFDFNSFYPNGNAINGEIDVSIVVSGEGDLFALVKDIESATRLSEVTSMAVSNSAGNLKSSMTIRTYVLEKQ